MQYGRAMLRVVSTVAYATMCTMATDEGVKMAPSGVRLPTESASLSVKRSTVPGGGLGVFLTRDSSPVKAGTVLTVYGDSFAEVDHLGTNKTEILPVHSTSVPGRPTTVRGGRAWAHKVPSRVDANEPVGHLINDGASISMASFLDPASDTIPQMIEAYYNQSFARMNVNFTEDAHQGSWEMVATRDIKPGEELFLPYGPAHWLNILMYKAPSPFIRITVYLFMTGYTPEAFPVGFVSVNKTGHVVHSSNNQPPSEMAAREFVREFLGIKGDKQMLAEMGITPGMKYVDRLSHLFAIVLSPEAFIDSVKDRISTEKFEEIAKKGMEEQLRLTRLEEEVKVTAEGVKPIKEKKEKKKKAPKDAAGSSHTKEL